VFEKSFLHKDALCDCSQPVVLRKRYEKRNKAVQFTIHFLFPLASYHKNRKKEWEITKNMVNYLQIKFWEILFLGIKKP